MSAEKPENINKSRRSFLKMMGAGATVAAASLVPQAAEAKGGSWETKLQHRIRTNENKIKALESLTGDELSSINRGEGVRDITEGSLGNKKITAEAAARGILPPLIGAMSGALIGASFGEDKEKIGAGIGAAAGVAFAGKIIAADYGVLGDVIGPYRKRNQEIKREDITNEIGKLRAINAALEEELHGHTK